MKQAYSQEKNLRMKSNIKLALLVFFGLIITEGAYAYKRLDLGKSTNNDSKGVKGTMSAPCKPAVGSSELALNNVRCRINTGGDMWWDFQHPKYEIPKGSGRCSMFCGSLWMAGVDANQQLKGAAVEYRSKGNDYWTGPLSHDGAASTNLDMCQKFDRHWQISKAEVLDFVVNRSTSGYSIPQSILDWPGNYPTGFGLESQGSPKTLDNGCGTTYQELTDNFLAPFYDVDGDFKYNPYMGDFPKYDLGIDPVTLKPKSYINCHNREGDNLIYGDETLWWVFNDKGNIHTEMGGEPIGMEIRAQAFAFATNDELNNMTFYNYQLINRSTYTLTNTYFSQWVDPDVGGGYDDYTGCDVTRGLGYCYNGNLQDVSAQGELAYDGIPPAVGVDFFQGPYMDCDGLDNPSGIENGINGVNFGDGIIDNERLGMQRFVYHNNASVTPGPTGDPDNLAQVYLLLRGYWKDGQRMQYGGNAHDVTCGPDCNFMFPGDTDPGHWGTGGVVPSCHPDDWTEKVLGNKAGDRRFMQSAGPFTLKPGAVNYITVGIPWAKASSGDNWTSVELLKAADDKCQNLFNACFQVVNGPDAPELAIQELDKELILTISNPKTSNNYKEQYTELDPQIPEKLTYEYDSIETVTKHIYNHLGLDSTYTDSVVVKQTITKSYDRYYHFQGYQIFQVKDLSVSSTQLFDQDYSKLVAECDVKDGVSRLINYEANLDLGTVTPVDKVDGNDKGIKHSFVVTRDLFATGDDRLVNHKKYYFVAIAYGFNQYAKYTLDPSLQNPRNGDGLSGQKLPYLAGRKTSSGQSVSPSTAIPHKADPTNGGTYAQADYGYSPQIIRIEGQGNSTNALELTDESVSEIFTKTQPPFICYNPKYKNGSGPINISVVDPLNVVGSSFLLKFNTDTLPSSTYNDSLHLASWKLINENTNEVYTSERSILVSNEQLIPEIGLSITIEQDPQTRVKVGTSSKQFYNLIWNNTYLMKNYNNGLISSSISYLDSTKQWLSGVPNVISSSAPLASLNWVRAGSYKNTTSSGSTVDDDLPGDSAGVYRKIIPMTVTEYADGKLYSYTGGTWAPYYLASFYSSSQYGWQYNGAPACNAQQASMNTPGDMNLLANVDVVLTPDKSKWTRCPVIELCEDVTLSDGKVNKFHLRSHKSVDKNGNIDASNSASQDPNSANFISATGMGWFPGYAINIETGERLNIAFGENSWLKSDNGDDMLFNPTTRIYERLGENVPVVFGGMHYVYVFAHNRYVYKPLGNPTRGYCPSYDFGKWIYSKIATNNSDSIQMTFNNVMWVGMPLSKSGVDWLSTEAKLKFRVIKPYSRNYATTGEGQTESWYYSSSDILQVPYNNSNGPVNNNLPTYRFNTNDIKTVNNDLSTAKSALDLIGVVPNPYYGYSSYETSQLDNRVKIINLPKTCKVSIYTVNGILIRQFNKDGAQTYIDWDLKNTAGVPISSGLYIIHVKVDGVGEKTIKWFGALRPLDLDSF